MLAHTLGCNKEHVAFSPLEELTALLIAPKPDEFCVSQYLGYRDGSSEGAPNPCLIIEYSPSASPHPSPTSLLQAIEQLHRSSLNQRRVLVHKKAQCLLHIHSVNRLHKAPRSENILLASTSIGEYNMTSPYVMEFNYSRRA